MSILRGDFSNRDELKQYLAARGRLAGFEPRWPSGLREPLQRRFLRVEVAGVGSREAGDRVGQDLLHPADTDHRRPLHQSLVAFHRLFQGLHGRAVQFGPRDVDQPAGRLPETHPSCRGDATDPWTSYAPYLVENIGTNQPVELTEFIETIEMFGSRGDW